MAITYTCPTGSLAGDAVYFTGATTVGFADADDPTKYSQAVIFEKLTDTTCTLAFEGNIVSGLAGLTAGSKYYLTSTATAGNTISTTESGWEVGFAISTTQLYITNEIGIVWEDLRMPAAVGKLAGVSNPAFDAFPAGQSTKTYLFAKAASNELHFTGQLPHDYKEGTDIDIHVHWAPIDTDTGFVRWYANYSWANINATVGNNATLTEDDVGDGTANKHQFVSLGTITGTGKTISSIILIRFYRDGGNDTYDNNAALLEIDIHYQKNTRGSNAETVK